LGVKLFHRTTRHVGLTEEGAIYSDRARKALEDLQEAEEHIRDLKATPSGVLKMNAPMSFGSTWLAAPIAAFGQQYPNVQMHVDFDDRWIDMVAEGYDIAVRIGDLQDSTLIARKIASCPIIPCASPAFLQQCGGVHTPADLGRLPHILSNRHGASQTWAYACADGTMGHAPLRGHATANTVDMMAAMCLAGSGIALLPIFGAYPHLQSGALVQVLKEYRSLPERQISVIFPRNRYLSTKLRLMVDHLTAYGRTLPWNKADA
jgi:DNA-binding transcriptional LysR family regulator